MPHPSSSLAAFAPATASSPLRLRPLLAVRLALGAAAAAGAVVLLGPFQGLEREFGLSDGAAHAMLFYLSTLGAFAAFPQRRRTDLALGMLALAALTEALQGLTGRSMSVGDLAADALGVAAAAAPALIERLRYVLRASERGAA